MRLIEHLNTLESSGLIRLFTAQPELEYLFRHALVQDAAYQSLLKRDRRQLHQAVGEALEQLYPDQRAELAAALAYHFEKAERREKAADYFRRAGDHARAAYANTEAIDFYQAALKQLLPDPSAAVETGSAQAEAVAQLYESLGDVLGIVGQQEEARATYQQGLSLFTAEERIWTARLHRKIGRTWVEQYRLAESGQAYEQADVAIHLEPTETEVTLWREWIETQVERCWLFYLLAKKEAINRLLEQTREPLEQFGTPAQRSKFFWGYVLSGLRGERYVTSDETLAYAEASLAAAQAAGSLSVIAHGHSVLGFVLLWRGELARAESEMLRGQNLCERTGDVSQQIINLTYLGILYRKQGQIAEAERYIQRSLALAKEMQMPVYIATAKANLGWLAWRTGDLAKAQTLAREALEIWQTLQSFFPFKWIALWPLIAISLNFGQVGSAIEYARTLLAPVQQRLPDTLVKPLEEALQASEQNDLELTQIRLEQAITLAQTTGHF